MRRPRAEQLGVGKHAKLCQHRINGLDGDGKGPLSAEISSTGEEHYKQEQRKRGQQAARQCTSRVSGLVVRRLLLISAGAVRRVRAALLFSTAALAEIAGCFAVWAVMRLHAPSWWLLPGSEGGSPPGKPASLAGMEPRRTMPARDA